MSTPPPPDASSPDTLGLRRRYRGIEHVALPDRDSIETSLGTVLDRRLSCRRFAGRGIGLDDLGHVLGGAYGVGAPVAIEGVAGGQFAHRPVPSGGAAYPLEVYVISHRVDGLSVGVHAYEPPGHALARLRDPVPWSRVVATCMGQTSLVTAAALVVVTGVVARSTGRYGEERGGRFVLLEAGHLVQTLQLVAVDRGLGSLPIGGFDPTALAQLIGVDARIEPPVYAVALGWPEIEDPIAARALHGV